MAHVQLTGNIGRGHYDGEGLGICLAVRLEIAALLPHIVDPGLNILRFIDLR
jgi:hypothetical protein